MKKFCSRYGNEHKIMFHRQVDGLQTKTSSCHSPDKTNSGLNQILLMDYATSQNGSKIRTAFNKGNWRWLSFRDCESISFGKEMSCSRSIQQEKKITKTLSLHDDLKLFFFCPLR